MKRAIRVKDRRGQSFVELALVGAVLALLLLGIIELVNLFSTRSYMTDASRAGVRLASLNYKDTSSLNAIMVLLNQHNLNTTHGGACDIQKIEIYNAAPDGSPLAGNNTEDIYVLQPNLAGTCQPVQSYIGWPPGVRTVVSAPNTPPPNVGVRITYKYFLRTPVFRAFGTAISLSYSSVLALGGDNANNFLSLPPSTPVPTFTASSTNTSTPTNTSIPTQTLTPVNTPTFTPTPTHNPTQTTWTVTPTPTNSQIPTITPTPTQTFTVTPTPVPTLSNLTASAPCDAGGHIILPPGIHLAWTGSVPGATSYEIHYVTAAGADSTDGTETVPALPGLPPQLYPQSVPPYYNRGIDIGGKWYVKAILPGGATSKSFTAAVTINCATNS